MKQLCLQGIFSKMKVFAKIILFLLIFITAAAEVYSDIFPDREINYSKDAFDLSFKVDIPVVAAGSALFAAEMFMDAADGQQQPVDDIIFPDNCCMFDYNSAVDTACDILFFSSLLLPFSTVIGADWDGIIEVGVMFAESMIYTWAVKDIIKNLVPRYRPYTYFSSPADDDFINSFPSGHTAAAFAVSGFASYVFSEMYPDSGARLPVIIGAYTVSTAIGVMRVLSGSHFVTDVAAGALIGSVFGIGIPMLHKIGAGNDLPVDVSIAAGRNDSVSLVFEL